MSVVSVVLAAAIVLAVGVGTGSSSTPSIQPCAGAETWTKTSEQTFRGPWVLLRSQGVTHDGDSWIFSWQGGLEGTTDGYVTRALGTWPPDNFSDISINPDGTNHVGGTHIGDVDAIDGIVYAPLEDGEQDLGVITINDPEYQQSHIVLYDANTLRYTGVKYPVPPDLQRDGVPWIAIDPATREAYTGEWGMTRDTLNVFDLEMNLKRTLPLVYPASFGEGFHLSRIQGGEVFGGALYVARDDEQQTIYKIDMFSGLVTRLFSLNGTEPSELEGLAIHPTADGALLHVILITDNDFDDPLNFARVRASFQHFALSCG